MTQWKQEEQLYCILKLYLEYGVISSSEIIHCLITDNDDNDEKCWNNITILIFKVKNDYQ